MEVSSAIPLRTPHISSADDTRLWGRVVAYLHAEVPVQAVLSRPWSWLNQFHHHTDHPPATTAVIVHFNPKGANTRD